jgi:glycerol-3-phosphate dehydrogenase (NAD(P)+)
VLWSVPTQHSAAIAEAVCDDFPADAPVISLSKGLERETLRRPSEILAAILPTAQVGVLSGPSHAEEVIAGLPVGLVCAGPDGLAERMQDLLHDNALRIYSTDDIVGVELGGALKNVSAIAAGICQGLELGDNMLAMLVTRGLAEIRRLGRALGAEDHTFAGLAGIGDLLTTCYSPHGRNRRLGLAVGRGEDVSALLSGNTVAEGAWTAAAAMELARRHDVELPIAQEVDRVLWHGARVDTALERLLGRSAKEED